MMSRLGFSPDVAAIDSERPTSVAVPTLPVNLQAVDKATVPKPHVPVTAPAADIVAEHKLPFFVNAQLPAKLAVLQLACAELAAARNTSASAYPVLISVLLVRASFQEMLRPAQKPVNIGDGRKSQAASRANHTLDRRQRFICLGGIGTAGLGHVGAATAALAAQHGGARPHQIDGIEA